MATRRIAPVRTPVRITAEKKRMLKGMAQPMIAGVTSSLAVLGDTPNAIQALNILRELRVTWGGMFSAKAALLGEQWAQEVNWNAKQRLQKSLERIIGIDMGAIIDNPAIHDSVMLSAEEAAKLITTIPEDYVGRISSAVVQSIRGQPFPDGRSLAEEIREIGKITIERAQVIARDQTSKMNAYINQVRQTSIGIEEYIWRTAEDNRVVGDPSGLYPKGNAMHGNHYVRNGRIYRWDNPPYDGPPGYAINCRCIAIPIVDRSLLKFGPYGPKGHAYTLQ